MKILIALASMLALSGCATAYQSGAGSYTGGYYDKKGAGKLYRIEFSGNSYITPRDAQRYNLLRVAEFAREQGKPHFLMYGGLMEAAHGDHTDAPVIGVVVGKPLTFAYVLLLDKPQVGANDSEAVYTRLVAELEAEAAQKKAQAGKTGVAK